MISAPILPFETVCRWSQLIAQFRSMPSSFERKTSDGISRMVLVMGAIVTSPRYSNTESRVRMRTGLFLSDRANLYQRISPRFIPRPKPVHFPKRKIHLQWSDAAHTPGGVYFPVVQCGNVRVPYEERHA